MEPKIVSVVKDYVPVEFVTSPEGDNQLHPHVPNRAVLKIFDVPKRISLLLKPENAMIDGLGTEEFSEWVLSPIAENVSDLDSYKVPDMAKVDGTPHDINMWVGWEVNTNTAKSSIMTLGYVPLSEIEKFIGIDNLDLTKLTTQPKYHEFLRKLYGRVNIRRTGHVFETLNGYDYAINQTTEEDLDLLFSAGESAKVPTITVSRTEVDKETDEKRVWTETIQAKHMEMCMLIHSTFMIHAQFNPYYAGHSFDDTENSKMILETLSTMDLLRNINSDRIDQQNENPDNKLNIMHIGNVYPQDVILVGGKKIARENGDIDRIQVYDVNGIRISIAVTKN